MIVDGAADRSGRAGSAIGMAVEMVTHRIKDGSKQGMLVYGHKIRPVMPVAK
jgi:uncharacterized OB-fold protein